MLPFFQPQLLKFLVNSLGQSMLTFSVVSLGTVLLSGKIAQAVFDDTLILLTEPLDVDQVAQYRSGAVPADGSVVTESTISQTGLTIPSLWWAEEQFGGKLLDYWVAYTEIGATPRRVDLLVNQQIWGQYNYVERYAFISHFGTSTSNFGYSTRIFNWQGDLLGAYICEFALMPDVDDPLNLWSDGSTTPPLDCQVFLDSTGTGALSGTSQLGAPLPTIDDTD